MRRSMTFGLLILLLLFMANTSHAQHWSYGLRPGGKRDAENLQDTYPETANEVSLFTEPQRLECLGPQNRINVLKAALLNWLDGDNARKKI
ncbi:progonadoliberin-1 [Discoglossus pictus]